MAKVLRLITSLGFLLLVRAQVSEFQGYTTDQLVVFFLLYLFIDTLAQVLFRGVYTFGNLIRNGEFDFYLMRPINPLFYAISGKPDINDALFMIPTLTVIGWLLFTLELNITLASIGVFSLLLINSVLIMTAFHIMVMAAGILLVEVDGLLWLYRDISRLGRFPVTIYLELMRLSLYFLVPIGFMLTVPAEVLMNVSPSYSLLLTILIGVGFFWVSLVVWSRAVQGYTSASS